jgi:ketosteroid isomerase-like protein
VSADRKQVIRDFLTAAFAGDRACMASLLTEDCKVWLPQSSAIALGHASPVVGRTRIIDLFDGSASSVFENSAPRLEFLHQIAEGDLAATHFRIVTRTRTGLSYENEYMILVRFRGGAIAAWWEQLDTAYAFARLKGDS